MRRSGEPPTAERETNKFPERKIEYTCRRLKTESVTGFFFDRKKNYKHDILVSCYDCYDMYGERL